jgi:hypothetical protein
MHHKHYVCGIVHTRGSNTLRNLIIHRVADKRSSRPLAADFGELHHTYSGKRLVPARLSGWKGGEDAHSDTALRPADARAD